MPQGTKVTPHEVTPDGAVPPIHKLNPNVARNAEEANWIQNNIKKRICIKFVKKTQSNKVTQLPPIRGSDDDPNRPNRDPICHCGHKRSKHLQEAFDNAENCRDGVWKAADHTKPVPTDAFGEMEFVGYAGRTGKYIRVDNKADMDTMLSLLMNVWKLDKPNLLISITGGAKNFHMKPRLKEVFRRGLVKIASGTGAWIITGGSNAGVMKHVGEAVREYSQAGGSKHRVVAIGVATWGCVSNKDQLISPQGMWPAQYRHIDAGRGHSPLDYNHSHFILVDNGTQHQYGVEIPFRALMEYTVSKMKTDTGTSGVSVPVVCVLVEGGPGSLQTVKDAIQNNTPCVIVEGSGRAADVLAFAYANSREEEIEVIDKFGRKQKRVVTIIDTQLEVDIAEMIRSTFQDERDLTRRVGWVKDALSKRDLITVFELDSSTSARDIDVAILHALLKANRGQDLDQLKLALAWNRIDVAKSEIFTEDKNWELEDLDEVMYIALQHDRTDFVKLFLENGLGLDDFLTTKRLLQLYNFCPKSLLSDMLRSSKKNKKNKFYTFEDIGNMIQDLMGDFYSPLYLRDERYQDLPVDEMLMAVTVVDHDDEASEHSDLEETAIDVQEYYSKRPTKQVEVFKKKIIDERTGEEFTLPDFDMPHREIFIWAVLLNRLELAMLFWDEGKEGIAAALLAQKLLGSMGCRTEDSELVKLIVKQSKHYEDLSVGLLSECYADDEQKAQLLLVRELPYFGASTIVLLAVHADNKRFIAHSACQALLNKIWMGRMSQENGLLRIWVCILCPPLLYLFIKFRPDDRLMLTDSMSGKKTQFSNSIEMQPANGTPAGVPSLRRKDINLGPKKKKEDPRINCWNKLSYFYNAPLITFIHNCLAYIAFLSLYSVILLTDFNPTMSLPEIILIVWVFTLFAEEIRQVLADDSNNFRLKFISYITDVWNILDVVTILFFITGMILRSVPNCDLCFDWARIILALSLMTFFFRILHIFSVHKEFGPKLVMIGRMMIDLCFFVLILMVFIVAYGLASQAILYPNSPLEPQLIQDVLRKAYWQMYGELFLEEIEGQTDCTFDAALYSNNTLPRCPANTWVVPILLGVYILITNILLFNLLIAMFSYTFTKIQENTDEVWRFHRFFLIKEYDSRPPLAPPLIFISHIYIFIRACIRICFKKCLPPHNSLKMEFEEAEEKQLIAWENMNADEYLRKTEANAQAHIQNRVQEINNQVDAISQHVEEIMDNGLLSRNTTGKQLKLPPLLEERLGYLEEQMKRTAKGLDWIIESMVEKGAGSKSGRPDLPDVDKKREKEKAKKDEEAEEEKKQVTGLLLKQLELHYSARQSHYPAEGKVVLRFNVPDEKVPWQTEWAEYDPVNYTASMVLQIPPWADSVDLMAFAPDSRPALAFNEVDHEYGADRRSRCEQYQVKNGLPLNPQGRTGLCGRGLLGRWGPNHAGDPIITRWRRDNNGEIMTDKGKKILEFVSVQRADTKQWAIPGGMMTKIDQPVYECLKAAFISRGTDLDDDTKTRLQVLWQSGEEVYSGYADDPRNTDNAWMETTAVNYHDEDGTTLYQIDVRAEDNVQVVRWQKISSKQPLYGGHLAILYKVAEKRGAAF